MNKLVVLAGVPGSGKSYFSKTLQKVKTSHTYIVSSDEIRKQICGIQTDLSEDELVWKIFVGLAKVYSQDKNGVVVLDATHISTYLRVDRNKELKQLFDQLYLVVWSGNKDLVMNQNLQREFPLPPEAMEMFFANFEPVGEKEKEFFDKIIEVKDNNIAAAIEAIDVGDAFKLF